MRDRVLAHVFVHGPDGDLFGGDGDLAGVTRPDAIALGVPRQLLAFHRFIPRLDERLHFGGQRVRDLELFPGRHAHLARALLADDVELAVDLGDDGLALRNASFEQLLHAGQALGDVDTGHTAGAEGAHRQLRARLTDRLRGEDARRLAELDQLAGREVAAVAHAADACARLAHG